MVDIEKAIEQIEQQMGRKLSDKEKQTTELFGEFMNVILGENDKHEKQ